MEYNNEKDNILCTNKHSILWLFLKTPYTIVIDINLFACVAVFLLRKWSCTCVTIYTTSKRLTLSRSRMDNYKKIFLNIFWRQSQFSRLKKKSREDYPLHNIAINRRNQRNIRHYTNLCLKECLFKFNRFILRMEVIFVGIFKKLFG